MGYDLAKTSPAGSERGNCYLLGYLPKHTDYKPTSPYLKEDLRKLDELSQQVRYMSKYGIETFDDLYADREKIRQDMDTLIARAPSCKTGYAVLHLPKRKHCGRKRQV